MVARAESSCAVRCRPRSPRGKSLVLAAVRALSNQPDLRPEGLDLPLLSSTAWPSVRVATLAALLVDDVDRAAEVSMTLLNDPSPYVRRQLVTVAARLGDNGESLRQALVNDSDCFIRASARASDSGPTR